MATPLHHDISGERSRRPWYGLEDRHSALVAVRLAMVGGIALLAAVAPDWIETTDRLALVQACMLAAVVHLGLWLAPLRWPRRLRLAVDLGLVVDAAWACAAALTSGGSRSPLLWLFLLAALGATLGYSARTGVKSALLGSMAYVGLLWHDREEVWSGGAAGRLAVFWALVLASAAGAAAGERELRLRARRLAVLHDLGQGLLAAVMADEMCAAARASAGELLPGWSAVVHRNRGPEALTLSRQGDEGVISVPVRAAPGVVVGAIELRRRRRLGRFAHSVRGRELVALETLASSLGSALWREQLVRRIERESVTDPLTGLVNRRGFEPELARELARSRRAGGPVAICLLDVDRFKDYNDAHGHQAGDEALAAVARAILGRARGSDLAARIGGEEMALLLPGTDPEAALAVAERVRAAVEAEPIPTGPVTVSIGVAVADRPCGRDDLMEAADRALYRAKERGRNRVEMGALPEIEAEVS